MGNQAVLPLAPHISQFCQGFQSTALPWMKCVRKDNNTSCLTYHPLSSGRLVASIILLQSVSQLGSNSLMNPLSRTSTQAIMSFSYIKCTVVTVYSCYMWACSYRSAWYIRNAHEAQITVHSSQQPCALGTFLLAILLCPPATIIPFLSRVLPVNQSIHRLFLRFDWEVVDSASIPVLFIAVIETFLFFVDSSCSIFHEILPFVSP
jgi:hypothetical protein